LRRAAELAQLSDTEGSQIRRVAQGQGKEPGGGRKGGQQQGGCQQERGTLPVLGAPGDEGGDRQQGQHRRQAVGQQAEAEGHGEDEGATARSPLQLRQPPVGGCMRGQRRQHRLRLVRVEQEADAAGQQQRRGWRLGAAVQFARGEQNELQAPAGCTRRWPGGRHHAAAAARMTGSRCSPPASSTGARQGRTAGESGCQPVATRQHLVATPMVIASSFFHGSWPIRPGRKCKGRAGRPAPSRWAAG
jgi:hypothetical protein